MEGDKDLIPQEGIQQNVPQEDANESNKRFKNDEEGDGVPVTLESAPVIQHQSNSVDNIRESEKLMLPKRASARELNYIDTNNILPENDSSKDVKKEEISEEKIAKKTAKKVGEYFKKIKKTKTIQLENRIEDINELNDLNIFRQYKRLIHKSSKLDMFIKEKLVTLKESLLQPPSKLKQNLNIKISSTFNQENSEWNLRIEGKVMVDQDSNLTCGKDIKMLNFFEKIFIDFEEDQSKYMNIDWRKLNNLNNCDYDAIDITRSMIPEKENIKISIKFFKEYSPKEFMISEKLSKLIDMEQGNIITIVNALWQYIKLNRLQDRDRRKVINCNKEMEEIFNKETIEFSRINGLLRQQLRPIDPIEVNYTIIKGNQEPKYLNIPVEICSRYRYELEDFIVANNINLITGGEVENKSDGFSPFENEYLTLEEKSIMASIGNTLRSSAFAYKFFKEYAENPKLKIQNTILEQKKYLEVMSKKESDLTFELEKQEDHSKFYEENQTWLLPEIEDYEIENSMKLKKEKELLESIPKEEKAE